MSAEGVVLEAINQNLGQAEEDLDDVKYEGADMTVAFNPGYLSDGVEAVDSDTVVLETLDALKPAVVRSPESGEFTYLLMPVAGVVSGAGAPALAHRLPQLRPR